MGIMSRISSLADTAGFGNLSKAFAETAMDSAALSRSVCNNIMAEDGKKLIRHALNYADDFGDGFEKTARQMLDSKSAEDITSFISGYVDDFNRIGGKSEAFQTAIDTYNKHASILTERGMDTGMDSARALLGRGEDKAGLGIKGTLRGFYKDADYGDTRLKATIAGAAGIAVGGRLLSGGSLTTNARGEHDIAGIPFI